MPNNIYSEELSPDQIVDEIETFVRTASAFFVSSPLKATEDSLIHFSGSVADSNDMLSENEIGNVIEKDGRSTKYGMTEEEEQAMERACREAEEAHEDEPRKMIDRETERYDALFSGEMNDEEDLDYVEEEDEEEQRPEWMDFEFSPQVPFVGLREIGTSVTIERNEHVDVMGLGCGSESGEELQGVDEDLDENEDYFGEMDDYVEEEQEAEESPEWFTYDFSNDSTDFFGSSREIGTQGPVAKDALGLCNESIGGFFEEDGEELDRATIFRERRNSVEFESLDDSLTESECVPAAVSPFALSCIPEESPDEEEDLPVFRPVPKKKRGWFSGYFSRLCSSAKVRC